MLTSALLPGFIASPSGPTPADVKDATAVTCGRVTLAYWGRRALAGPFASAPTVVLSRVARRTEGAVPEPKVAEAMAEDPAALIDLLPPFGAVAGDSTGVRFVADSMGFEHIFHSVGSTPDIASTSALLAGREVGARLDERAVAVQSLLGWQLGQRTLLEGIRKLEPGAVASMGGDGLTIRCMQKPHAGETTRALAVARAADILRTSLTAILDDHPDAVLQLTGGMDSRLLLSAIPPSRRKGLRAMTLDVPGRGDVAIARMLAQRYGMLHDVRGLTDVAATAPEAAWELCRAEATRLDGMADPVALAAQRIAERSFAQGIRISGLGGEVARGFYYVGAVRDRAYSRSDAARLADWRMFVNDAVEPGLLTDGFSRWAHEVAVDDVHRALQEGGPEWYRATDALYLRHRMQRWAGATDTAVSDQRVVINPMLDHRFLSVIARLSPQDKADSRFLGQLQMALDPALGRIPLDGRPAPAVYARPPAWRPITQALRTGTRVARKAAQRLQRGNRPPAGGEALAAKVVEHWRSVPQTLQILASLPFVSQNWVTSMLEGNLQPRPSSVALVTNLIVALDRGQADQARDDATSS